MNKLTKFLVKLGGDSPALLSECSEKACLKRSATGAAVFVPCIVAAFGSGYMTHWMTGNHTIALLTGICWGLLIGLVDRAFLATIVKGKFQPVGTLIRVAMAVVASAIFAHPLVLKVFEGNIASRIEADRSSEVEALKANTDLRIQELRGSRHDDTGNIEGQLTTLRTQQKAATTQLEQVSADLQAWRAKHHVETEGQGASGLQGDGPRSRAIMTNYILPLTQRTTDLRQRQSSLDLEERRLSGQLETLQNEIASNPEITLARQEQREKMTQLQAQDRGDLLTRFRTLHTIMAEDRQVQHAYYALTLLLLLLELAPLLTKMLSPADDYDFALQSQQADARATKNALCQYLPELRAEIVREDLALDAEVQQIRRDEKRSREKLGHPHRLAQDVLAEKGKIFELLAHENPPVPLETSRAEDFQQASDRIDDSILERLEDLIATLLSDRGQKKNHQPGKSHQRGGTPPYTSMESPSQNTRNGPLGPRSSPIPFPDAKGGAH